MGMPQDQMMQQLQQAQQQGISPEQLAQMHEQQGLPMPNPQQMQQQQGPPPPSIDQSTQNILGLIDKISQNQNLNLDVQTKAILALSQGVNQLLSAHATVNPPQQGVDPQIQAQHEQFKMEHQHALDLTKLQIETEKHQQDMQQSAEKHQMEMAMKTQEAQTKQASASLDLQGKQQHVEMKAHDQAMKMNNNELDQQLKVDQHEHGKMMDDHAVAMASADHQANGPQQFENRHNKVKPTDSSNLPNGGTNG